MSGFDYGAKKADGQFEHYPTDIKEKTVLPFRDSYVHTKCGALTKMGLNLAMTYATNPGFYGATFCVGCHEHFPLDEFVWDGTDIKMSERR